MVDDSPDLAEVRTHLAHERTYLAYIRTATTIILFGLAFVGLSQAPRDFYWYAGYSSLLIGTLFFIGGSIRAWRYSQEIARIKRFFYHLLRRNSKE